MFHLKVSLLNSRSAVGQRLAVRLLAAAGRSRSACSDSKRRMSPGWQESASQIASSVEKRIARALPVLRIERLARVIPTLSASSVSVIRRSWSRSSSLTAIAISHRSYEVFAHERAFREHAGQHEREQDGEPSADRKAGIELDGMRRSRNGLADRADGDAENLQPEQRPGDLMQTGRVGGDEWVARANRLDDREQPLEDNIVQRDCDEAKHGDRAQAHDHPLCVGRRRKFESTA